MKKFFCLAAALSLVLSFASCGSSSPSGGDHRIDGTYPFYIQGQTIAGLPLHFLDGVNDLPYLEANDMVGLLNLLFELFDSQMQIKISKSGSVVTCVRKNDTYHFDTPMTIDFERDLIRFEDYNVFLMKTRCSSILDVTSFNFFNNQGKPRLIKRMPPTYLPRFGDPLIIDFAKYGIDLPIRDGKYLIPLQTVSDIFIAPTFLSCLYFNGKSVIFESDLSKKGLPGNEASRNLYYAGNRGERSAALAQFGYKELCMALDLLYGLKEQHGITSFDRLFQNQGAVSLSVSKSVAPNYSLKSWLTGPSALDADKAIYHLIGDFLDDNHAKWLNFSYLVGENDAYQPNGAARERLDANEKMYKAARESAIASGKAEMGYHEVDDTAFVTFDAFAVADAFQQDLDKYYTDDPDIFPDDDTIGLIMKAHKKITRENSPVKNVVIDLSANTGGAADTAVFVASWFLGEATVSMKYTSTGALCSTSYRCDANRDHEFDEKDTLGDRKLFCLVTPVSFSCGNLVPSLFRESEKVTLLGKTSGGGACVVQFISSAWGTSFRISGPQRLCYMKNGSYYDIDQGARPDHSIENPADFYDRAALVTYINSLR